jgi:hypothetical protein
MKKWLKITLMVVAGLLLIPLVAVLIINEPRPELVPSKEADQLAEKMLAAVDKPAWDTTHWVQWTFAGRNSFVWDRERNLVQVKWGEDQMALIDPSKRTGRAFVAGQAVEGPKQEKMVQNALSFFYNDSFWFLAPTKVFDPGTQRGLVELPDGEGQGLLVSYSSGGVTPGDAYLWILDENGLPKAYRMWVNILPVGGLKSSWEDWKTLPTGAKYAASHILFGTYNAEVSNVNSSEDWASLGLEKDPFDSMD